MISEDLCLKRKCIPTITDNNRNGYIQCFVATTTTTTMTTKRPITPLLDTATGIGAGGGEAQTNGGLGAGGTAGVAVVGIIVIAGVIVVVSVVLLR